MLDDRDRRILDMLQKDAGISVTDLAERVALSVSACSRRIQRLEETGYIARRIVVLDRERMGVPTTVFALVKTAHHSDEWTESFRRIISDIPEIVEAHRLTGNHDYILKIVLPRVEPLRCHLQADRAQAGTLRRLSFDLDGRVETWNGATRGLRPMNSHVPRHGSMNDGDIRRFFMLGENFSDPGAHTIARGADNLQRRR